MSIDDWGSPFGRGGKKQLPNTQREVTRNEVEIRRYNTGCDNLQCEECYPGASRRAAQGGPPRESSSDPWSTLDSFTASGGSMREVYERLSAAATAAIRETSSSKPTPSDAYRAARKECESWICEAPTQEFSDIVGNDEALAQLRDAIQAPVLHTELYAAYGMKMPKGALLSGPPGCGKTMFARAAAAELSRLYGNGVEFLSISGSELQSPYVGQTEEKIISIFKFAKEYKAFHGHPLLVVIDECEVILPDRTGRVRRVAPWEESQVATFLAEMDGITESAAFVLLASNRPEVIDQAVLRDGRCDFKIAVKRPNREALELILQKNFEGILLGPDTIESLVMTALEMLLDPHKILLEESAIRLNFQAENIQDLIKEKRSKHFLLEHIVSGAMAASIPMRAKRSAFARDKKTGVALGVLIPDVIYAVNQIFEENKSLDHAFALKEFMDEFLNELNQEKK